MQNSSPNKGPTQSIQIRSKLKIIKIKKPNCMKIDNIKFMRKIVIMLQLRKRKKNSK